MNVSVNINVLVYGQALSAGRCPESDSHKPHCIPSSKYLSRVRGVIGQLYLDLFPVTFRSNEPNGAPAERDSHHY